MKAKETPKEKLNITWFGHSAFLLKAPRGKSVLIDPWLENPKAPPGGKRNHAGGVEETSSGFAEENRCGA